MEECRVPVEVVEVAADDEKEEVLVLHDAVLLSLLAKGYNQGALVQCEVEEDTYWMESKVKGVVTDFKGYLEEKEESVRNPFSSVSKKERFQAHLISD